MTVKSHRYGAITRQLQEGDPEIALPEIHAGDTQISPPERLECLGNYLFYTKQRQAAVDRFEEAMTNYPGYQCARYHYLVGVQEEMAHHFEAAFHRYNAAIEIEPSFPDAYIELAGLLVKVEDYEGAAKTYERALELDPKDIRIYYNLMEVYRILAPKSRDFLGRFKSAEKDYTRLAAELGPLPDDHQW
jgi:tetratricopeptide (TPR) repeat protein